MTTTSSKKKLRLAGFIYSGQQTQIWRHPKYGTPHGSLDLDYYIAYAQRAEAAKYDTLFLADGASFQEGSFAKHYWSVSASEPATLFSSVASRTEKIGLVYTASVSDNKPTHVARQLASFDQISRGRAGLGREIYKFLSAVKTFSDSFEDDVLLRDKQSGVYADLNKVHWPSIDDGLYKIDKPLTIERPVQGHPIIAQAGKSPEGIAFGGSTADLIFCAIYSRPDRQKTFHAVKDAAIAAGRDPDHLIVLTVAAVVWGDTQEEAERKLKEVTSLWPTEVAVLNLQMVFGDADIDGPFPETFGAGFSKGRSTVIASYARTNCLSIRQTAERCSISLGHRTLVGTMQSIADGFEAWLGAEATEGFAVIQPLLMEGLKEFTMQVVPELLRRGIFREEYEGRILRENLGLSRPENEYMTRKRKHDSPLQVLKILGPSGVLEEKGDNGCGDHQVSGLDCSQCTMFKSSGTKWLNVGTAR